MRVCAESLFPVCSIVCEDSGSVWVCNTKNIEDLRSMIGGVENKTPPFMTIPAYRLYIEEADAVTGILGLRFLDPEAGRWISARVAAKMARSAVQTIDSRGIDTARLFRLLGELDDALLGLSEFPADFGGVDDVLTEETKNQKWAYGAVLDACRLGLVVRDKILDTHGELACHACTLAVNAIEGGDWVGMDLLIKALPSLRESINEWCARR